MWPTDALPDLERAFKACGRIVTETGLLLARRCDELVAAAAPGGAVSLAESLESSVCHKARLLHYFAEPEPTPRSGPADGEAASTPRSESRGTPRSECSVPPAPEAEDSWCGWHFDHGTLTGLCAALYLTTAGDPVGPDRLPTGLGLRVRDRAGGTVRVAIPADALAFQIGEAAQVASGGVLRATAHCVAGGGAPPGVTRETFAVFMQPR